MIPNGTFPHQFARLGAGTERYEVEHHHCGGNEGAGQVQIRADRRPRRRCNPRSRSKVLSAAAKTAPRQAIMPDRSLTL